MNREHILFQLREAQEEINSTIDKVQGDSEYDEGEFLVALMHLYHHINTAWNARNESPERTRKCSDEDFKKWRHFPVDIDMAA